MRAEIAFAFSFAFAFALAARAEESDAAMGRKVQEELRAHGGDVHGCWGAAIQAGKPGMGGEVLVRLFVAPGGVVERAEILKDQVGSKALTDCLVGRMRAWKVPKLAGDGTQQIVFPLAFQPDAPAVPAVVGRVVVPSAEAKPGPLPGGKLDARVLVDEVTVGDGPKPPISLTKLRFSPSTRLALHTHPGTLELLYVVRGLARLRDGFGSPVENAEAGDLIIAWPDAPHNVEAAPLAPLELVQVFAPAGPERAYRDRAWRAGTVPAKKQPPSAATNPLLTPKLVRAGALRSFPIAGGKGSALLLLDGLFLKDVSLQRLEVDAGAAVPTHQHDTSDELFLIVSGRGELEVAGAKYAVGAGDGIRIPKATPHALRVTDKIVAVQCYAPAGPEERFKR